MANVREEEETEQMELISHYFHLGYGYEVILDFLNQYHDISLSMRSLKRRFRECGLRRNAINDVDEQRLRNITRRELRLPWLQSRVAFPSTRTQSSCTPTTGCRNY